MPNALKVNALYALYISPFLGQFKYTFDKFLGMTTFRKNLRLFNASSNYKKCESKAIHRAEFLVFAPKRLIKVNISRIFQNKVDKLLAPKSLFSKILEFKVFSNQTHNLGYIRGNFIFWKHQLIQIDHELKDLSG